MPRKSIKTDKNIYFQSREKAHLTREAASDKMDYISQDRIERIESEKSAPHPDEVLTMAEVYQDPLLINYYCTNECPIGKKFIPTITDSELSQIVLEIMDSVNGLSNSRDRLISISADGIISESERPDLENILENLERVSAAAGTLKLLMRKWLE